MKDSNRASTLKNCKDVFRLHVKGRLGKKSLRDFRTVDGEQLLKDIARQARTKSGTPLTHNWLSRIKSFLSGVFTVARRKGVLDTANPMVNVSIPAGSPAMTTHAYSLGEIKSMLAALDEPAKTVVLLASWTGLRQGEIRGLRWADYNANASTLNVARSIWNKGVVNRPKTSSSAAPIHVVKELRDALEAHREREAKRPGVLVTPESPIFQSGIGTPINLANLAKRIIAPRIEKCVKCRKPESKHLAEGHLFELDKSLCWHGWHAFRRGLATNLHALRTPDREIQAILRHSNIAVTQASYIKSVSEVQIGALDLVAEKLASAPLCNENATKRKEAVN